MNTSSAAQKNDEALLSNDKKFTIFQFDGLTVRFRTSDKLEQYTKVLRWDRGYIEVMAKYSFQEEEIEEYIDLEPILENLYIDADQFLNPIKKVRICYD